MNDHGCIMDGWLECRNLLWLCIALALYNTNVCDCCLFCQWKRGQTSLKSSKLIWAARLALAGIGTKSQMHLFNIKMRTSMHKTLHGEQPTWGVWTSHKFALIKVLTTMPSLFTSLMVGFTATPSTAAPTCCNEASLLQFYCSSIAVMRWHQCVSTCYRLQIYKTRCYTWEWNRGVYRPFWQSGHVLWTKTACSLVL